MEQRSGKMTLFGKMGSEIRSLGPCKKPAVVVHFCNSVLGGQDQEDLWLVSLYRGSQPVGGL